jgi:excisionase family DNA binding protein
MSNNRPFTTGQAAKYCHVSQATIINWIKDGRLEAYTTPGGHYRILKPKLVSFLEAYRMPVDVTLRKSSRPRLLLVGNSRSIKRLAQALNDKGAFDISVASSGYTASAQMAQAEPDAVVIDMGTSPHPLELCRWVREFLKDTTLLLLGDPEEEASARAAGAHEYLNPDALTGLQARLEVLLQ